MTKKEIHKLILKILGIYSLIKGCLYLPMCILSVIAKKPLDSVIIHNSSDTLRVIILFSIPIIYFVISYLLLIKSDYITEKSIMNDVSISFLKNGKNERDIFELVVITVGWVTILNHMYKLVQSLMYFTFDKNYGDAIEGVKFLSSGTSKTITAVFMLVIGICFILYASKVATYIYSDGNKTK